MIIRHRTHLIANNRALATNAACRRCGSTAEAYQLVVIDPEFRRLSPGALADLHAWTTDRASAEDKQARAQALRSATTTLEQLVNRDLGTTTLLLDAEASVPR